jgi:transposase
MMSEKTDVIRRLRLGQAVRAIARETGLHRTGVRRLREIATSAGWLDPEGEQPREEEIAAALARPSATDTEHPLDAYREDFERWTSEKISYVVMHQLIAERYPCSEATVRRYVQRHFPDAERPVMVRPTMPGQIMEVDFGYLGITYDPEEKRNRKTYVFSGRLRHSRHAYRERVYRQDQQTFFRCHIHAFERFGGVPEKVVPDNLKAAVIEASVHDPIVNRAYHALARHYGFLISPCLPATPQHKGGVESDIKYVKRNFWPMFVERQRRLGHETPYGDEMVSALERWDEEVARERLVKGVGRSPREIFETEERQRLGELPLVRWDPVTVAIAKVQQTWRIQFDRAFYSVPQGYVGKTVQVLADSRCVRIFFDNQQITMHQRATQAWQYRRKSEHAPPQLEEAMNATREGLLRKAASISAEVHQVAREIFERAGVDGMRPVRGLLAFQRSHGAERLTAACRRALAYERPEYRCVKNILAAKLDLADEEDSVRCSNGQRVYKFARRPGYFSDESIMEVSNG